MKKKPTKSSWSPYRVYLDVFCECCGHASAVGERGGVTLCDACFSRLTDAEVAEIKTYLDGLS